jgi:hypothetical protein
MKVEHETDTEKSEFCSIEVLDETADSKATVLNQFCLLVLSVI